MKNSIADHVAPQLPHLRRFARALTGSQHQGDAYVAATLEVIIADPEIFQFGVAPRIMLYRIFLHVWNFLPVNHLPLPRNEHRADIADRRIATLTPRSRQAFLLFALEEFSVADIATILQVTEREASHLVEAAGQEVAAQIAARVLIIEDEPLIALDLETLVTDIGHAVVGIAATRLEAMALVERAAPGIVLADIQLADGSSGIDAVGDILKQVNVPVIFITAFPERLLTGECAEPVFVITKPFQPEMVKAAISQALFFDMRAKGVHRGEAA